MLPFFLWELATVNKMKIIRFWNCNAKDECHDSGYSPQLALLGIIVPYIVLHSFSSHKEFRFLLPILPLICILAGYAISRMVKVAEDAATQSSEGCGYTMSGRCFPTLPKLLLVALILLNYPQLFYLGLIHQRGPIAVSRYLVSVIEKEDPPVYNQKKQLSIHYLMGCHSAPLYSHVHIPNVPVVAWQLDCSPNCRSNPDVVCESDAFSSDSLGFVMSAYGISGDDDCAEVNAAVKGPPSFLIIMQDDVVDTGKVLTEKLNMTHVASIRHSVKHLSWHNQSDFSAHDVVTLFSLIDIHFDHMEVYSSS
jgi:phosphatidylinositol glycan class B